MTSATNLYLRTAIGNSDWAMMAVLIPFLWGEILY